MTPDHRFLDDLTETSNRVEPARVIANPDAEAWDATCDVLVVGIGLAGVCAALRASEDKGLDVIAIDRGDGGGASKLSGGVVYMGGGTKAQREADAAASKAEREAAAAKREYEKATVKRTTTTRSTAKQKTVVDDVLGSRTGQTVVREVLRGIFSTLKRK